MAIELDPAFEAKVRERAAEQGYASVEDYVTETLIEERRAGRGGESFAEFCAKLDAADASSEQDDSSPQEFTLKMARFKAAFGARQTAA